MVNYGAAFRLPFTNWRRFGALFILMLVISFLSEATSLISGLGKSALVGVALKLALINLLLYLAMILFSLIANGYSLRIARSATQGKNTFPPFENFFSLIVPGLKYFLATLIYLIPFIIAVAIGLALIVGGFTAYSASLALVGAVILVPVLIVLLIFLLMSCQCLWCTLHMKTGSPHFLSFGRC